MDKFVKALLGDLAYTIAALQNQIEQQSQEIKKLLDMLDDKAVKNTDKKDG